MIGGASLNSSDFLELILRFGFTILIIYILVQIIYTRNSNRKDYYFSYFAVGITVFFLTYLLNSVKLEIGFALGLFAIFGIIRYRTTTIPIKEMTYMFVIIGVSVINALASTKISYAELFITNAIIIFIIWLLEKRLILRTEFEIDLVYEKIELIHAGKQDELLKDLRERTGMPIHRVTVKRVDFLRDTAQLTLYYYEKTKLFQA